MTGTPSLIPAATLSFANLDRVQGVETALRNVFNATRQPLLQAQVGFGDKSPSGGGKKRTFSIQVTTRDSKPCEGQYLLAVTIGTALAGPPAGAQTTNWITGEVVKTETADQVWLIYTNTRGLAELEVTVVGGTSRWVRASVLGVVHGTDEVDFA